MPYSISRPIFRPIYPSLVIIIFTCFGLAGCESSSFYYQLAKGHLKIMNAREPIKELIKDTNHTKKERTQFQQILKMRAFAAAELHLPVDDHYSEYVDLKRDHVVWNVFAAPQLSLTAETWCFPIAGCVSYRGYFAKSDAEQFAHHLSTENLDTYVDGVAAYSTLGWFDDPVLNTFLFRGEASLAALLFHELSHKLLYVKDDSAFNESFATTVETEGLMRWLNMNTKDDLLEAHLTNKKRHQQFIALVLEHRDQRQALFDSSLPDDKKLIKKQESIKSLREEYQQLKISWGGHSGYDKWFDGPLNNAQLSTIATYNSLVAGFQKVLARNNNDLAKFYQQCQELTLLDKTSRHKYLTSQ